MWIKLCANTNPADVQLAVDVAADAVGFVFARSPRHVTPEQVAAITPTLPSDLTHIGVFQSHDRDAIVSITRTTGLNGIQLHGGLDLPLLDRLRTEFGHSQFLIQTLHWALDADPADAERRLRADLRSLGHHGVADAILLDAKTAAASGGTGRSFDWSRARALLSAEAPKLRIILAGGLTPANVADAIRTLRPWGVDVVSGIESSPGKKDPARVRAFVAAARDAFAAIENHPLTATQNR